MKSPESQNGKSNRSHFLRALSMITAGALFELKGGFLVPQSAQAEGDFWPPELTKIWFSVHDRIARDKWKHRPLDAPEGAVAEYDLIYRNFSGNDPQVYAPCHNWSEALRQRNVEADGYCAQTGIARTILPLISFDTTYFIINGEKYEMDFLKRMELITALATQAVPLGLRQYAPGSGEEKIRLSLFVNGTARWPFIMNRPKLDPNTDQIGGYSFVVCGDVSDDGKSIWTDDYNLRARKFSIPEEVTVLMTYDPILPIDGQIPDALQEKVRFLQNNRYIIANRIFVDPAFTCAIVYGQGSFSEPFAPDLELGRQILRDMQGRNNQLVALAPYL